MLEQSTQENDVVLIAVSDDIESCHFDLAALQLTYVGGGIGTVTVA